MMRVQHGVYGTGYVHFTVKDGQEAAARCKRRAGIYLRAMRRIDRLKGSKFSPRARRLMAETYAKFESWISSFEKWNRGVLYLLEERLCQSCHAEVRA